MNRLVWLALMGLCLTGCGPSAAPLGAPVKTTGKVVDSAGKPVGNVTLNLQPLESGYTKLIDLKADGTFEVETQSGKYAYFFTPKSGTKQVPPQVTKYAEASMDRTVQVAANTPIDIQLQ